MNEGNNNALKWSVESATELFNKALELSKKDEYDFIGEIAKELNTYRDVFTYLSKTFPELKPLHNKVLGNCEANCFSHGKKGEINPAIAIMNLKANYKWTDRVDTTSKGNEITNERVVINFKKKK